MDCQEFWHSFFLVPLVRDQLGASFSAMSQLIERASELGRGEIEKAAHLERHLPPRRMQKMNRCKIGLERLEQHLETPVLHCFGNLIV